MKWKHGHVITRSKSPPTLRDKRCDSVWLRSELTRLPLVSVEIQYETDSSPSRKDVMLRVICMCVVFSRGTLHIPSAADISLPPASLLCHDVTCVVVISYQISVSHRLQKHKPPIQTDKRLWNLRCVCALWDQARSAVEEMLFLAGLTLSNWLM